LLFCKQIRYNRSSLEKEKFGMKKHIFGFALFSLIVATFAFIYTVFYAPSMPSKNAVKPPVSQTETRSERPTACFPRRPKQFYYTIDGANYYVENNVLVSKITLYWNGSGAPPAKISVQPRIFMIDNSENPKSLKAETLIEPFKDGNSKSLTVDSKFVINGVGNGPPNLYVVFEVLDAESGNYLTSEKVNLAEAFHILTVYPDSSELKVKNNELIVVKK